MSVAELSGARAPARRTGTIGPAWILYAVFPLIPVWWLLGLAGVIVPLVAVAALVGLLIRGWTRSPRALLLWLLFVLWVVVAMTQVPDAARGAATAFRLANYIAGAIFFLYIFNAPRQELSAAVIVKALAIFWVVVVAGGVLGMIAPAVSIETPFARVLPGSLRSQGFIADLVTASTSAERAFASLGFHRPKAPFPYTNQWGAVFALTLPFAVGSLRLIRRPLLRQLMALTIAGSIVPLVFSLDRGAWLSAALGMTYAAFRLMTRPGRSRRTLVIAGLVVVAVAILATPLKDVVLVRLDRGYGDEDRAYLYTESIRLAKESPIVGYGAPVEIEGLPSVGTHGHFWTVLVSFGVVGALLFLGWLLITFLATRRAPPWCDAETEHARFWCHIVIFTALVQLPYYELLPWGLPVVMIAAAVGWRERLVPWLRSGSYPWAPSSGPPTGTHSAAASGG